MRYAILSFLFLINISHTLQAQKITVDKDSINFGMIFTTNADTQYVTVINNAGFDITIYDINSYSSAFTIEDTAFVLAPGGQRQVAIYFAPRHNIIYDSEIVVVPLSDEGSVAIDIVGTGKYIETYYDPTQNLSEEALKQALKLLLSTGFNSLGYNLARDKMFMDFDNKKVNGQGAVQNTLEGIYTGTLAVGYTNRSDAQNNYNFNTEHTFPQGTFNQAEPMRSDLYHLFPTLASANSERGNKGFGYVSNPSWQVGGSKSNSSTFEPRDVQKGPTARAMLYFLVRYFNYQGFVNQSQQTVLKEWHSMYLPDSVEEKRNDNIAVYQNNRNPFIDHPELADRITNFIGTSVAPVEKYIRLSEDTIDYYQVYIGNTYTYNYVLVNDGNMPVNITGATLTGADFNAQVVNSTIPAGESGIVQVELIPTTTNAYLETLTITSNADNGNSITVPVKANKPPFAGVGYAKLAEVLAIFPNPAGSRLHIRASEAGEILIYDIYGREIKRISSNSHDLITVDISSLPVGIYFIKHANPGTEVLKFYKSNIFK